MIERIREKNINTKKYLDGEYTDYQGSPTINDRLRDLAKHVGKHRSVLDVGCADGLFIKYYLKRHPQSKGYGCDLSTQAIKLSTINCPLGNFRECNCYDLPYPDNIFDLVVCSEVLEHLEKPKEAIMEMGRVLKNGGTLVMTTPNENDGFCEEHLWKWDIAGVKGLLGELTLTYSAHDFWPNIMLLKCKKNL